MEILFSNWNEKSKNRHIIYEVPSTGSQNIEDAIHFILFLIFTFWGQAAPKCHNFPKLILYKLSNLAAFFLSLLIAKFLKKNLF